MFLQQTRDRKGGGDVFRGLASICVSSAKPLGWKRTIPGGKKVNEKGDDDANANLKSQISHSFIHSASFSSSHPFILHLWASIPLPHPSTRPLPLCKILAPGRKRRRQCPLQSPRIPHWLAMRRSSRIVVQDRLSQGMCRMDGPCTRLRKRIIHAGIGDALRRQAERVVGDPGGGVAGGRELFAGCVASVLSGLWARRVVLRWLREGGDDWSYGGGGVGLGDTWTTDRGRWGTLFDVVGRLGVRLALRASSVLLLAEFCGSFFAFALVRSFAFKSYLQFLLEE